MAGKRVHGKLRAMSALESVDLSNQLSMISFFFFFNITWIFVVGLGKMEDVSLGIFLRIFLSVVFCLFVFCLWCFLFFF